MPRPPLRTSSRPGARTRSRLVPTLVTLLTMLLTAGALPSWSATYRIPTDAALIHKAGLIVRGHVTDLASAQDVGGGIYTDVAIAVETVLKGRLDGQIVVVRQPGGRLGDRQDVYPGIGTFAVGETVLLMLDPLSNRPARLTDFAIGKFTVLKGADGREFLRRDGLIDAHTLAGSATAADASEAPLVGDRLAAAEALGQPGPFRDPDRDAASFEDFVGRLVRGLPGNANYTLPPQVASMRTAEFEFLGSPPCRWIEFDSGQSITYKDNSTGDAGNNCQPGGCHGEIATGMTKWNGASNTQILLVYGGTDPSIGTKCLNALDNEIQFGDSASSGCNDMSPLDGCTGTLAIGGFSNSLSSGGSPSCPAKGNPSFQKITSAKIMVNKRTGTCLSPCDYTEMIAHETGHTLGAGHSPSSGALMAAYLDQPSQCGLLRADDVGLAQCAYPSCGLSASMTWGGPPPLEVSFSAGFAGGIGPLSYDYDFGDGSSDSSPTPTHTYSQAGTYTVAVTVSDSEGNDCNTETEVTVQPCVPSLVTTAVAKPLAGGLHKALITGTKFKKGSVVEIHDGSRFVAVPITKFKTSRKLVAKNIDAQWPVGQTVTIRVLGPAPAYCPSNPVSSIRF